MGDLAATQNKKCKIDPKQLLQKKQEVVVLVLNLEQEVQNVMV